MLIVVAVTAGCGGTNADQKANTAYAHGVCTAIGGWLHEIEILETTAPADGITKAFVDGDLASFRAATTRFVDRIKAVRPPDTAEGRAAKSKLGYLVSSARASIGSASTVTSTLNRNSSQLQLLEALSALVPDLQSLKPKAQSTLTFLQSGGASLAGAFKSEPACQRLG